MAGLSQTEISELIQKLVASTATTDQDDIVLFAEIHGWCERLVESAREDSDNAPAGLLENAQAAAVALENLIMGADDPRSSFDAFVRSASALAADPGAGASATSANPAFCDEAFQAWRRQFEGVITSAELDDLPGLAKLHGTCQAYVQRVGPKGEAPEPTLHEYVSKVCQNLEALILGASDSPAQALRDLREMIAAPETSASGESQSHTKVEVGMAKVFGDGVADPAAANTPAAPDPDPSAKEEKSPAAANVPPATTATTSEREASFVSEPLVIDPSEVEFVAAFLEEASEHIEAIEVALLEVEQAPEDPDKINELFRPFHTIKGMAGFLNLRDVNALTHEVETLLDQGRRGDRELTAGIIDLVFEVIDILKAQIAAISASVQNPTTEPVPQPPVSAMIDHLRDVIAGRIVPDAGIRAPQGSVPREAPAATEAKAPPSPSAAQPDVATKSEAPAVKQPSPKSAVGDQSVRIDTHKLDALVDLVGELVIAHTQVAAHQSVGADPKLNKDAGQVTKIVRDVQEITMAMRMVPIKSTFQKMGRLVRDLSRKAGKNVELTIAGEETELDKNVIQQIGDPLVHMVRNACDHGIESPEKRAAVGKPECGHVHLNAFHQGGNIVIEISDDGKGLDPQALIVKAIEKGIVGPDEELTDDQAFHLVFAAGFSTAEAITDISGRGVGMDVVRRNIEQLRGKVEIASEKGKGSTFSIRLPLTLAIIDGMLVSIGDERFIVPTNQIEQALRPRPEQITTVQNRGELLQVRGQLIPLIQLGQMFQLTDRIKPTEAMVVITHTERGQVGFVVDALIGQQQVVIKSLGERLMGLRGVSGAAILGDGKVGLILDASGARGAYDEWRSGVLTGKATPPPATPGRPAENEKSNASLSKGRMLVGVAEETKNAATDVNEVALV